MKIHPLACNIPEQSEEEYQALLESIRKCGQLRPILVYQDQVLDGRHRLRACKQLGIEPKFQIFTENGSTAIDIVVAENIARRNLNPGQRACLSVDLAMKKGDEYRHALRTRTVKHLPKQAEKSNVLVGRLYGVGCGAVSKAMTLKRRNLELFNQVLRGEVKLVTAWKAIRDINYGAGRAKDAANEKRVGCNITATKHTDFPDVIPTCHSYLSEIITFAEVMTAEHGWILQQERIKDRWYSHFYGKRGIPKKEKWTVLDGEIDFRRSIVVAAMEAKKVK